MKVLICFEDHHPDGKVWALKTGKTWQRYAQLDIRIPLTSVYKGPKARQPRAYFEGECARVVRIGPYAILLDQWETDCMDAARAAARVARKS